MENSKKTHEVLNDLIRINNDRIAGYETAIKELPDMELDLKTMFTDFIGQSKALKTELQQQATTWGGRTDTVDNETTTSGKIYRGWMDVKKALATNDRKAVLESCEFGEDAAQKVYRMAEEEDNIPAEVRSLITAQKNELLNSHDRVKHLRDLEKSK